MTDTSRKLAASVRAAKAPAAPKAAAAPAQAVPAPVARIPGGEPASSARELFPQRVWPD